MVLASSKGIDLWVSCRNRTSFDRSRFLQERRITKTRVSMSPIGGTGSASADANVAVAIGGGVVPTVLPLLDRPSLRSDVRVCSQPVCERQDAYLREHLEKYQEPCEDFYAYVCSRSWAAKDAKVCMWDSVYLLCLRIEYQRRKRSGMNILLFFSPYCQN